MKSWRVLGIVIILLLVVGSVSADAPTTTGHPAKEPWTVGYISHDQGAGVGEYVSIAHHPTTGKAYISYSDYINGTLMMAQEVTPGTGDCPGNANWKCEIVDDQPGNGKYSSIDVKVVPGEPPNIPSHTKIAISYYNETDQKLKVATYALFPFPAHWTIQTVDDSATLNDIRGTYTSVKFPVGGNMPVIAYHSSSVPTTTGSVKIAAFVGSGFGNCGDGNNWQCYTVDSGAHLNYGSHVSLDFNYEGKFYIAYYDSILGALKLADDRGDGGTCSNQYYYCLLVDDLVDSGPYVSLHAPKSVSDVLRLAYAYIIHGDITDDVYIKYAENVGSGGNCGLGSYDCYIVDAAGSRPGFYDIAMDVDAQGYPIIAYMDASVYLAPTGLKIARPALAYGQDTGNCGESFYQYWQCNTIDAGNNLVDEAAFVAISVSPSGLATIAYSEYYDDYGDTYLKVAQQHFMTYMPMITR